MDWSRVGDSAVLMVPTAVVSGYLGARIKAYVDRARPVVSVENCRIARGADLLGLTVNIRGEVAERLRDSPWTTTMRGEVSALQFEDEVDRLKDSIVAARQAVAFLDRKLASLSAVANQDVASKRQFLDEITRSEVSIVDATYVGLVVRDELRLDIPQDDVLAQSPVVAPYSEAGPDEPKGGYRINLGVKDYLLRYKHRRNNPLLLPIAKAFSVFHVPSLTQLLDRSRTVITRWAAEGDDFLQLLEGTLDSARCLVVEVSVVNRGRTPALFSQWGLMRLAGNGDTDLPAIEMQRTVLTVDPVASDLQTGTPGPTEGGSRVRARDGKGFVIEGTASVKTTYHSLKSIEVLEREIPNLRAILSLELFQCQVALRRADLGGVAENWILSARTRFSKAGQPFPSLEASELARRWA